MKEIKRAVLIVLDSLGIGALPDADGFGDAGADTFGHISETVKDLDIKNMQSLGFCNIYGVAGGRLGIKYPKGTFCRLGEKSAGKDTTVGHWEIAGLISKIPFKTYPEGFPAEFIAAFEKKIGRKVIGNHPASGTAIIEELGHIHESTGSPIVYTSADSVFQIAVNTDVIPLEELYDMCATARKMLVGDWACGRVIARPYVKEGGKRIRTADRKDYSVSPPEDTVLDKLEAAGKRVHAIGKINDIFNGKGITTSVHTVSNEDGVDKTIEALETDFSGLIFTNLVDFDAKYGHRRDPLGYGRAIEAFDKRIPDIMEAMSEDDILILTADHGNDPTFTGTDHTREYVPLVMWGERIEKGNDLGTRDSFADIGATLAEILGCEPPPCGKSML